MWREAKSVVSVEWLKRRRSRAVYIGPLSYTSVLIILYIGFEMAARHAVIGIESGFFLAGAVLTATTTPLAFVAILITSYSIAREFSQGTIELAWTRPIGRRSWLVGKSVYGWMELMGYFVLTIALILLASWVRFGFDSLTEKTYVLHTQSSLWLHLALSAGLTILGLAAVAAVAVIPAVLISSPGGALAATLIIGFVMQIGGSWGALRPYLPTTYIALPFEQFVAMSKGLPVPWEWGTLVRVCVVGSIIWGGGGWLVAAVLTTRKEITG